MGINIIPVQPVANQKSSPEKGRRDKGRNQDSFSQVLRGMVAARSGGNRQDGFGGRQPRHRDTLESIEDVLRRIEQVNNEIRIRML